MRWILRLAVLVCLLIGLGRLVPVVQADDQVHVSLHLAILPYHQCDSLVDRQIRVKAGCFPTDKYQPAITALVDSESLTWVGMESNSLPVFQTTHLRLTTTNQSQPMFAPIYSRSTESQTIRQTYQVLSYSRPPPLRLMV